MPQIAKAVMDIFMINQNGLEDLDKIESYMP